MSELQGTDILFRRWDPATSATTGSSATTGLSATTATTGSTGSTAPKAVFLLIHGLGAHSARWEFLAGHLAANGYASYAPELRGFGRTPERPRGHVDSFRVWERDILALREKIDRDFPGKKVFLLGESMGGLIAYDLAGRHAGKFAGAVLIAPAFKNGLKFPLSVYLKFVPCLLFDPQHMVDVPFTSETATRDLEYAAIMNANPDELRIASLKLLAGFIPVQARARRLAKEYAVPTLFLIPGVDHLVDEAASRKLFKKVAVPDRTLIEYPEMFHALSIDLDREKVFRDIVEWTGKRV